MNKILMGPQPLIYPMPMLLVGANIDGKPNFMAVAWCGIANGEPPMISMSIRHRRHTLIGIRQNMTFSANIPSTDLVKETDYCGIAAGSKVDKVEVCKFKVFYGKLENAPLIAVPHQFRMQGGAYPDLRKSLIYHRQYRGNPRLRELPHRWKTGR